MHIDLQHSSYFVHQQFVLSSLGLNLCVWSSAGFLLQFWKQQEESVRQSTITERKWKRHEQGRPCEAGKAEYKSNCQLLFWRISETQPHKVSWESTYSNLPTTFGFERVLWCCSTCNQSPSTLLLKSRNPKTFIPIIPNCWSCEKIEHHLMLKRRYPAGNNTWGRRRRMWSWKGWHFVWGITSK